MADETNTTTTQDEATGYQLTPADAVSICTAKGARLIEFTDRDNATAEKSVGTITIETDNLKRVTFHVSEIKGATQAQAQSALAGKIAKASK